MTSLELEDVKTIAELPYDWDKLNGKTLLISGGTGFVGTFISDVIRYRNKHFGSNTKIVSLSRHGGESDDTVTKLAADITNPILYDGKVDFILHLASNTHPAQYAKDPVGTITTNIIGCDNLLKLAVEKKIERFLLASSVEIYGQGTEAPMDEKYCGYIDCNNARAGYNEAKRTCEALCRSYESQYGVNVVIARLARTVGADHKKDTKAMAQFMDKAVAGEDIILKSKGNQRFSYSYIADTASGVLKVLLDGASGEAYNVSDEDEGMTLGDYAGFMARLAGKKVVFDIEENASVSKASYALLSIDKIKKLGWKPMYSVSDGLKRTYQIYKER
ncbi:MAG: NAD-dependent epimerase/dehydratase family protein [Lachnospiraceae bacterium]|uniref:NAD-dependent epimerase/dehydratase family protein n=1 Tax=Candidatus Weimeria bifida TaxID=2599074 RepID=A0A6N7J0N0_9FIRM|nr:NAD-dependent epimerase/dehydratase family protein [Candidatus Weimeria bifida]RRF95930.1 MAG: NAD-dependent epimerase/dehydratase family protein [Lachnospiraceae bacterium]